TSLPPQRPWRPAARPDSTLVAHGRCGPRSSTCAPGPCLYRSPPTRTPHTPGLTGRADGQGTQTTCSPATSSLVLTPQHAGRTSRTPPRLLSRRGIPPADGQRGPTP